MASPINACLLLSISWCLLYGVAARTLSQDKHLTTTIQEEGDGQRTDNESSRTKLANVKPAALQESNEMALNDYFRQPMHQNKDQYILLGAGPHYKINQNSTIEPKPMETSKSWVPLVVALILLILAAFIVAGFFLRRFLEDSKDEEMTPTEPIQSMAFIPVKANGSAKPALPDMPVGETVDIQKGT